MSLNGSMRSFIFINACRRNQNGGHHCKRTKGRAYHIAHNVAVIVFACPDEATLCFHDARYRVVDQGVEIFDTELFELLLIFVFVDFLENILKGMVIFFGNCILGRKPQILLRIYCVIKASAGKARDRLIRIVHAL